jgi:putative FmdB family regulatory protein
MPFYDYICSAGHRQSLLRSMMDSNALTVCPECGKEMKRDWSTAVTVQGEWVNPQYSEAAGVMPEQIAECKARFPHHEFTPDGRMIFRSRQHKTRCLKDIGMVEKS